MRTISLTQNYEFRRLYYRGANSSGRLVTVYYMKNNRGRNRLGLTVGVKVGGAVVRNYVRRRIRESYRLMEGELRGGFDIVIVAKPRAAESDFHQIDADLRSRMDKLGLFKAAAKGGGAVV